ncbi:MAG: hypothetical protein VX764_09255 [Planctomycetota bacterium]|nr:hypothetical protein [Planctomycetota bacterium]
MSSEPDQTSQSSSRHPGSWSIVIEVDAGILRIPVARIDDREVLLDTPVRLKIGDRFELIVERPDGHADLVHAEVVQRSKAGLLMRWKPSHPREITALERLFSKGTSVDGQPDIETALRSRSRLVRTSAIAAQRDSVRVLNLSAIKSLIQDAVEDTLRESGQLLEETELKEIIEESEKGFRDRLAQFEDEKADLQSRIEGLSSRLERAQDLLDRERNREVDRDRFALSETALGELEHTFEQIIDEAISSEEVKPAFESELRSVMERCLDSERDRVHALEENARSTNIDLLERKIQRLARSLDDARVDRDQAMETVRRTESRDQLSPSPNAYQPIKPSSDDGQDTSRRRALLLDLVQENRELRKKIDTENPQLKITEKGSAC